jgi:alkylation response protein AidB-like acyl-CoA dehydrogenase
MSASIDARELRESLRGFLAGEADLRTVRAVLDGDAARGTRLWSRIADLGWLGLAVPAAHGGLGLGFAELSVAYQEFGRALAPVPFFGTTLAAAVLAGAGSERQQAAWLPLIAAGEIRAAVGLPRINGAVGGRDTADGCRLRGTLRHVLDAAAADAYLVPVDTGSGAALAWVARDSTGVSLSEHSVIDRTRSLCDIAFSDTVVPAERLLHPTARAWTQALDHAALAIAGDSVGGAGRILEMTVDYLKTRVQFDRPIGSFQALKHRCATWKILLEAATALTASAAEQQDGQRPESTGAASAAKLYGGNAYASIAGDAVQLHGGIGFTWDHDCHLFLKRAKLNQQLFGNAALHRDRVAEEVFPRLLASEDCHD